MLNTLRRLLVPIFFLPCHLLLYCLFYPLTKPFLRFNSCDMGFSQNRWLYLYSPGFPISTRTWLTLSLFKVSNMIFSLHPIVNTCSEPYDILVTSHCQYLLRTPGQPITSREINFGTPKHCFTTQQ